MWLSVVHETIAGVLTSLEICAGAGGQALGLEQAGFKHVAVVENDAHACETLRLNRAHSRLAKARRWAVREMDVKDLDGHEYEGVDLFAGGVPCPPFSVAGKQLGAGDERDLFPTALNLIEVTKPKAVLLENVKGLSAARFAHYRQDIISTLEDWGYVSHWQLINASEHGVAQLRPRFVLVALQARFAPNFAWPAPAGTPPTVGEALYPYMAENGWPGAAAWAKRADGIGPTLVGGSKKHGGPDLGPTRARQAWAMLGVNGGSLAEEAPGPDFPVDATPRLTVRMAAALQGFPKTWKFYGRKTAAYRQVGNAFPPPVAAALGKAIARAITSEPDTLDLDLGSSRTAAHV
ncbi:DNA cytosine methyltransferase [Gordonia amicalis]|uniref:DNA cytosine methyltransferase n=1 Tax=Gordonia amicalis TaxID=89053 RepID=UPI00295593C9|nr:DNA cytosine methyltransferase [Gordonia amicalis]MDV7172917.1 DNA cytosine methyltransferase [Gordonia amicalis]